MGATFSSGLFGVLAAPFSSTTKEEKKDSHNRPQQHDEENPAGHQSPPLVSKAEQEETILAGQRQRETEALARDDFCKYQRARYLHKTSQTWYEDAYILGVHHDDGVDQPYYTIVYQSQPEEPPMEKQTTRDRLAHTAWDEVKTRKILTSKGKL